MNSKYKTILKLGLILSIPMLIILFISHFSGFTESKFYNIIFYTILALSILFVQKHHRDNFYRGIASYAKLFSDTFLMICISGIIIATINYIDLKFISPETVTESLEISKAELYNNSTFSDSQIELSAKYIEKIITPFVLSFMALFGYVFMGLIINLLTSAINKRKGDDFNNVMKEIKN